MSLFKSPHQVDIQAPGIHFHTAVAQRIRDLAEEAISKNGRFNLALTGGSTPRSLYEFMATEPYRSEFNWQATHLFFGDERGVPYDHPDSNYRMAREALIDQVSIPIANIHPLPVDQDPKKVDAYQALLRQHLPCPSDVPIFDLILLGLGPDGHIASLFPNTLALEERQQFVLGYSVDEERGWRITLTFPVLEQAQRIMMLVSGNGKQAIINRLAQGDQQEPSLPIERLATTRPLEWRLDRDAAQVLLTETHE